MTTHRPKINPVFDPEQQLLTNTSALFNPLAGDCWEALDSLQKILILESRPGQIHVCTRLNFDPSESRYDWDLSSLEWWSYQELRNAVTLKNAPCFTHNCHRGGFIREAASVLWGSLLNKATFKCPSDPKLERHIEAFEEALNHVLEDTTWNRARETGTFLTNYQGTALCAGLHKLRDGRYQISAMAGRNEAIIRFNRIEGVFASLSLLLESVINLALNGELS